jgi:outer membrane protein OmpA-like peptidoglycan-associated protein
MKKNLLFALWYLLLTVGVSCLMPTSVFGQLDNLGPNINSGSAEKGPVISADGKTLYFVRENHPENVGGVTSGINQDIWYSTWQSDNTWSPAINLKDLNDERSNFISSITPDGNIMVMGRQYVERTKTGWSAAKDFNITVDNRHKQNQIHFNLAQNGKVLVIAFQGANARGFLDLYVSFLDEESNRWSNPKNLGATINGFGNEYSSYLASDGVTLYFSSDGYDDKTNASLGGGDIYVSRRLDDTWTNWTKPENLGPTVNTPEWDAFFVIPACGDWAYMVSTKNSMGISDVFRLPIPQGMKPNPVMLVRGKAVDEVSGQNVDAKIKYYITSTNNNVGKAAINPATDDYTVVLPVGQKYRVVVTAPNYMNDTLEVDLISQKECVFKEHTHKMRATPTIIKGKITDGGSGSPLPATLRYTSEGGIEKTTMVTASGEYRIMVPGSAASCNFVVEATGFDALKEQFNIPADVRYKEATKNFTLSASAFTAKVRILNQNTKAPVANATLNTNVPGLSGLKTDANGEVGVRVPAAAASYNLNAEAVGYRNATDVLTVAAGQREASKDVFMIPRPPLTIFGKIKNENTKAPINEAKVRYELTEGTKPSGVNMSNGEGDYKIELEEISGSNFVVKKDGYITVYEKLELTSKEPYQEIRKDMELLPIEIGTTVRLKNIQFEFGKATLLSESFIELDRLVSLMEDASKLVIEIAGHTDNVGDDASNKALSDRRANSVRDYLLSKGVSDSRIVAKGYGEEKPLVDNKTKENQAINRRVEFRVLKID